jgi:hypothetical protein
MVTGITERNKMKTELAGIGYSLKYIDEWQPKITLYRHKPACTVEGDIAKDIGTAIPNLPGNPDYVLRKSKIGLFQWPPSDTCECQWCKVRVAEKAKVENKVSKEYRCDIQDCGFDANGKDHAAKSSSLRMHMRNSH